MVITRLIRQIASLPWISLILSKVLPCLDTWLLNISGGNYSLSGLVAQIPVSLLITKGAKTGKIHRTPVLAFPLDNNMIVIGSNFGTNKQPAWYFNLLAHPKTALISDGEINEYIAREANNDERTQIWEKAYSVYIGYQSYRKNVTDRKIPIMILMPLE